MNETWKVVDEFPVYSVSNFGRVRRDYGGRGVVPGRLIKWHTCTSTGYPTVRLSVEGKVTSKTVHTVVARAFLGKKPAGMVVRHLDGNKLNNAASNLAYGSIAENNADKIRHGTSSAGEKNPKAKLTAKQAASIRLDYGFGLSAKTLAISYGISPSTVFRIVSGIYWKEASNRAMDKAAA